MAFAWSGRRGEIASRPYLWQGSGFHRETRVTRTFSLPLLIALLLVARLAGAPAAALEAGGATQGPVLPVERTPFHVPAFRNDAVSMLNVWLPPHRVAPYHEHSRDFAYVVVRESPTLVQNWGDAAPTSIIWPRGAVGFGAFSKQSLTHRAENVGDMPLSIVGFELLEPAPKGRAPSERPAGFTQIIDNERLRGWRLALKPGEITPAFTQRAPGVRIVVEGGELIETDADGAGQNMALQPGDFQWRDAGPARALRNAGATTIELVEFEVK
ncbi:MULTISPECIES: hypothetical protein [Methylosinus]|uniref:Cupin domain-containing protein n=1 Tax=Methylosinus sporium TaxID=428 RepID=A0A2U1SRY2_METSR|nr:MULTISPECIES: hypothetical protein [Methylosinus]PWB94376.1 hypothetical protein C5689_08635 [Methylosinus sporium]